MNCANHPLPRVRLSSLTLVAAVVAFCLCLQTAWADKILIPIGKSFTLQVVGVKKILAVKEGVVEVLNVSDQEVILAGIGEAPSATQLIVWDGEGKKMFDVETYAEVDTLQKKFSAIMAEPGITLQVFPDVVYMRGVVDSPDKVSKAEKALLALANDRKIENLLEIRQAVTLQQRIQDAIQVPTVKVTVISPNDISNELVSQTSGSLATDATKVRVVLEGSVLDQNELMRVQEVVRGYVSEDNVSNLLTISKPKQVLFQAYVLQVDKKNVRDLGIDWGGTDAAGTNFTQGTLKYLENVADVFRGDVKSAGAPIDSWANPFKVNNINRFDLISAQVKAWETKGKVRVLANPKLTVYANAAPIKKNQAGWYEEKKEVSNVQDIEKDTGIAFVTVGQDVYYPAQQDASGRITYDKATANLKLMIRDMYINDGKLKFSVYAQQDEPNFTRGGNAPPDIARRSIMTTVQVGNQDPVVLGGLISKTKSVSEGGVPGLSRLPFLGRLFQTRSVNTSENELVIILTPQILQEDLDLAAKKKFEVVPVPRRSDRLEQLHQHFQKIKGRHFPSEQAPQ